MLLPAQQWAFGAVCCVRDAAALRVRQLAKAAERHVKGVKLRLRPHVVLMVNLRVQLQAPTRVHCHAAARHRARKPHLLVLIAALAALDVRRAAPFAQPAR